MRYFVGLVFVLTLGLEHDSGVDSRSARAKPVNIPLRDGVQIELPPEIRHENPFWKSPCGKESRLDGGDSEPERLVEGLARAARSFEL